jgi:hypothetical protein
MSTGTDCALGQLVAFDGGLAEAAAQVEIVDRGERAPSRSSRPSTPATTAAPPACDSYAAHGATLLD